MLRCCRQFIGMEMEGWMRGVLLQLQLWGKALLMRVRQAQAARWWGCRAADDIKSVSSHPRCVDGYRHVCTMYYMVGWSCDIDELVQRS